MSIVLIDSLYMRTIIKIRMQKHPDSYWCAMRDLNPHGRPLDPKSSASANSANRAYKVVCHFTASYKFV